MDEWKQKYTQARQELLQARAQAAEFEKMHRELLAKWTKNEQIYVLCLGRLTKCVEELEGKIVTEEDVKDMYKLLPLRVVS